MKCEIEQLLEVQPDGKLIHQGWSPQCDKEPAKIGEWGVLKTTAIQDGFFLEEENKRLPEDKEPKSRIEVKPGDLLVTNAGPRARCGVICYVKKTRPKLMISGKMYRLRFPENLIHPEYIESWLRTSFSQKALNERKTGISESGLNMTQAKFKTLPIVVAPFEEQKAIADKLDSLLAQVNITKTRLERTLETLKQFRQSVLADAVSGKLTEDWNKTDGSSHTGTVDLDGLKRLKKKLIEEKNVKKDLSFETGKQLFPIPVGWHFVKLKSVATKITDGEHKTPKREQNGRWLLSARNVRDGYISLDKVDYVGEEEYEKLRKRCDPQKGDILISCSGSVGRISLVDKDDSYVMVRSVALVKTCDNYINNRYLEYALRSPMLQKLIEESSKATAQANLFLGPIKELDIPLPSITEQNEIVHRVDNIFASADATEQQINQVLERVNNLTQSILAKAFRGELTEQWRKDNPELVSGENSAEALLEKIKAERAVAKPKRKTRKKTG
ncbi:restriction endonuclease subunit S [Vibrio mediterranei]|uniref:restriction endonuclease subunit S n=1 Tax=Vibrio mediterranei TaxID=689 RepID=UPI00148CB0F4|nr:restriction endonuclease subunit S [Vibrio mediterranei]